LDGDPDLEVNVPELEDPHVWVTGIDNSRAQPYHLEVWCEKSTMDDIINPVCERYGANLSTFEGEVSITACYDLVRRIEESGGKPARVFYISDFDPAGKSMPVAAARKVEYMLTRYELNYDVKLIPIVLTQDQVRQYTLPRKPIKDTERRAAAWETIHGQGAVELDALEALYPGELARIVGSALPPYYSHEAAREVDAKKQALRLAVTQQIEEITGRYQAEIEALASMVEELTAVTLDTSDYQVDTYPPHVKENGAWLFDSQRGYVEQITVYKAFKGGSIIE
jgi:hypothetical protein